MVVDTDILQFTLHSFYDGPGNEGLNVFQYEVTEGGPFSLPVVGQELINEWMDDQADILRDITSTIVTWGQIDIVNLTNPLEVWSGVPDTLQGGAVGGDTLPPYAAWAFKLTRTTAATRNGAKRFWGVPESYNANGQPAGAVITSLPIIAAALAAPMVIILTDPVPNEVHLAPSIVRKDASGALLASQPVLSGQFRSISTQNTRKFGRGM